MQRIVLSAAFAVTLLAPSAGHAMDAIYGVWSRDGHAHEKLEFYDCSGKLCAKGALPLPDGSPSPQILRNASKTGANSWSGDLFNPEDGKTYKGTITLESPTKMTLKGCLVAFLCQSETWTRVSGPTKPGPKPGADAKAGGHDAKAGGHDAKAGAKPKPPEPDGNTGE